MGTGILFVPNEILETIFKELMYAESWKLARTCKALWNVLFPQLYPAWHALMVSKGVTCGRTSSGNLRQCGLELLDVRDVEHLLKAPSRILSNLEHFMVVNLNRIHLNPQIDRDTRSLIPADQLLLKFLLQRLSVEADQLNSIRFSNDISSEIFKFIIASMPNLRSLRFAGVQFEETEEDILKIFETVAALPHLETLEINVISDFDILKKAIDVMTQKAVSVTCLRIRRSYLGLSQYIGRDYRTNEPGRVASLEELTSRFFRYPYIGYYPMPVRTQRQALRIPTGFEVKGRVLHTLHLDCVRDGHRMVLEEIERGAKITNLQLNICIVEKPKEFLIGEILDRVGPLETLHISALLDWDISKVLCHRETLERLWLECHMGHHFSGVKPSVCPGGAAFFDPDRNPHPFTSEHWPKLEELAIPFVDWDKLPVIHSLRVLRLLNHHKYAKSAEYRSQIEAYVERLRITSISQYNQLPHLKMIVFDKDRASYTPKLTYYVVNFEKDLTRIKRTRDVEKVIELYTPRPRLLLERMSAENSPWEKSDFSVDPDEFREDAMEDFFDLDPESDSEAGFSDFESFIEDDEISTNQELEVEYRGGAEGSGDGANSEQEED